MRYFLDTEYDGFGGPLLSLALVPEDGGEEFYAVIAHDRVADPWVERHVVPFLDMVPEALGGPRLSRRDAAGALVHWLAHDSAPDIIADWPEDLAQLAMLLVTGPGQMVHSPPLTLRFVPLHGFSTAANSAVPHNALHDARALRDHIMKQLE
ncbi:MAG: hypothetical protein H0W65_06190 [Sphingomonas sp.]|uniref:hypothetical protein n=1 Tax=Sphingomonas sp. TaxID=28214 RepID=UPI0017C8F258|nr:hypothetical protein [Sphingomonas sp.]MBA3667295.1 hypothetical protein [Sphingomonas sp.]